MATSQKKNLLKKGFMFETNTSHSIEIGRIFYSHLKDKKKSLNIFTANVFDAISLKEELIWFYPELRINHLPDWETLPLRSNITSSRTYFRKVTCSLSDDSE